ncbi:MAG: metallophosphoesterase [Acidobacteriia bacterium]|nr:metallophosphoesterase [Terriglobia bacterium]
MKDWVGTPGLNPFELILIVVFVLAQWRISVLLLRAAVRRFSGRALILARTAVFLLDVLLVMGYLCSWSDLMSRLGIPGRPAMLIGAFTLAYGLAASALLAVRTVLLAVLKHFASDVDPGRRRVLSAAGNTLMAAPLAVMGYGSLIQRTDFRVREIDLPIPGLPGDLDGLRVLQLSDIHLSAFLSEAELARVIDAAIELRSHLTVITGDLISSRGDPLDACIRQLARLKADAGVFGCMGNHERYAKVEDYTRQAAARVGIRFLRSASQPIRFGNSILNLAGVDYQSLAGKKQYLRGAETLILPGACNVLLSHNPDVFPVAAQQGYNLLLAGHTHGGQVTVEILDQSINPARFFTPFVYGLYRSGSATAYVTRGIGTIGIPTRIGAPPEISLLRLRKA